MIDSQIYRIRIGLYAAKGSFRLPNKLGTADRTDSLDPATGYVSSSILDCIYLYFLYSIFILYFAVVSLSMLVDAGSQPPLQNLHFITANIITLYTKPPSNYIALYFATITCFVILRNSKHHNSHVLSYNLLKCIPNIYKKISKRHSAVFHKYKIDGPLLRFLISYLKDRKQQVVVGNEISSCVNVNSGVPQGSIIGPLLFVLFINDIGDGLSNETSLALYADDTKIWREMGRK